MKKEEKQTIEIMDTTLRDGEQMQNVSYTPEEKLTISKILLTEVKVDRLEVTSARVSEGEKKSVLKMLDWAKEVDLVDRFEILGFVDKGKSVDWAKLVGIKRINLLTKGSLKHCTEQLKKTPEQHTQDIRETILYATDKGIDVNIYLEDFSNGIKTSPDYVYYLIDFLLTLPVKRIMLPDTLGIFNPFETYDYVSAVVNKYPKMHFDFHSHNDYGLGTANAMAAVKAGVKGVHVTVNGMGERAGNSPLDEVVASIKDFLPVSFNIDEKKLHKISSYVEMFSGIRMANNKPIYGKNVFTQTAGIHADGDKKGSLYGNKLLPKRFDRKRKYALGKLSGKANLEMSLKELSIELTEEEKKILLQKIIELGDKKEVVTTEDLPYLISDIFETPEDIPFKLLHCSINSTYELKSVAAVQCAYQDKTVDAYASGDGGYNAFMNALQQILTQFDIPVPQLLDYEVTIPPGGKTDALVQAAISWKVQQKKDHSTIITTRGVNSDQNMAAIEATVKMINMIIS
ncbi:alpha-isopropylmalate synthase regulatory domain-containing protein [Candidatus Parabeggiatoa sp. HSG14]|uniref:alpha-isopropylmalate synthase regulatory domain-containing protein n=1 Tax=Candidatus Parabeggiatoa sp. HSG14 TaxID=3055593 RepID=UPI0025A7CA32|nr:alpha-isopropylmalate synthase regulatory domain-containing protein [Thiotrichales bacterium HSG14]